MFENIYLTWFVIYACLRGIAPLSHRYTLRREGFRILNDMSYSEVECSSLISCAAVCNQDSACLTVSYRETDGRCIMSTTGVTHTNKASTYLVADSEWMTISKAIYKVFHVFSPLGLYQATYADAVTLCAEYKTIVASPVDLLESRALGLSFCRCGWLSDGTNGFVLQTADWRCWGSFHTNILYCNHERANAWCRL